MKRSLYAVLFLATLPAFAQTSPKPAESPKPPVAAPAAAVPPLSETEKLKLENIQLKFSLLQTQQTELQGAYQAFVQGVTAEHPGFVWNAQSNSLVAAPQPPVTPPAAEKK